MSSKILFAMKMGNATGKSIYSINPDGTDKKVFIPYKYGFGEYNPDISPDGSTVLFNTYRFGGWKLALFNIRNKTIKNISTLPNYYVNGVFSPCGNQIVYERNISRSTHIFMADKNGNNEILLTSKMGTENRAPAWTMDGKSILFFSEKERVNNIYKINIENKSIVNLTNSKSNDFNPCMSPDGKQIAFYSDRNGYLDLYLMNSDGSNLINLTNSLHNKFNSYNYYDDDNTFWIFKISWSPDGKSLVFSNVIKDNVDLFTINKDGSNLKQITFTPESEFTPVWGKLLEY